MINEGLEKIITPGLISILRENFVLDWWGIHGAPHWARVKENGLRLAEITGAKIRVVQAFAFLHDSCRKNDWVDSEHGLRAGEFARSLVQKGDLLLSPDELELLVRACEGHSSGQTIEDITVCTCWDSDRLDLGRVGMKPNARYLCTEAAKSRVFIAWAYERSIRK